MPDPTTRAIPAYGIQNLNQGAQEQVIRGAIETANATTVSGWLHSNATPLRGQLVLAFIGQRCVGTGKVEIYRKDLHDANLGNGYCGFYFPVKLLPTEDAGAIVVRLIDSDLALLQAASRVSRAKA